MKVLKKIETFPVIMRNRNPSPYPSVRLLQLDQSFITPPGKFDSERVFTKREILIIIKRSLTEMFFICNYVWYHKIPHELLTKC